MFGKDELAAILRFGAEDLFKTGGAHGGAEDANTSEEAKVGGGEKVNGGREEERIQEGAARKGAARKA